jgi:hypothetical protein
LKNGLIGIKISPSELLGCDEERNLVNLSPRYFPHEGHGNDDISSEEHFENSKTSNDS